MSPAGKIAIVMWLLGEKSESPFVPQLESPIITTEQALALLNFQDKAEDDEPEEKVK